MVEFISPINPGAAPVARRDSYFRPLLDDREASALGELAQAYGQLRRATGSLADSYGALGQRFNQLSGAIMENQREQLRGEQRQKDLQIQQKRLDLQEQRNAFALQADRERLQLAVLREQDADIRDQLSAAEEFSIMNAQGNNAAFALGESVMAGLGAFPTVSNDMSQGGVTVHNTDIAPDLYSAIEQAGRTSGVNYTVTPAATPGSTQYAALGEQVGVNTPANLELNNPGFINWIADAPESVKQKAYDVFGADIVSNGTDLLNLDKVQRAVPAFKSMEDGVRYMGFWAQYRGVSEGSVDQAVRQWFGLNLTGPVEDTKFDDEESRQATLQAYRDRLSIMRDFGLDADAVLSDTAAKAAFVQGTMRAEISGYNTDKIFEALPNMPWGQLFSEGQAAFKTGKLVRNTAGSAEIFAGSREAYDLKPNQMRISLDFNSTPGASGALVVIPPSATPQQTKQAKAYVDGVQKLFQEFGYEGYTLSQGNGIQVSGGGNRGLSNTIHTEPFFAEDPMAVQIFMLPEFQKRYANLLMRTLGAIDGAVIMAPHEEGREGAVMNVDGNIITERQFALDTLIPNLQAMRQEGLPGNKINIAADDGARPLAMDGSDPSGNVAVQALEGYGVAVNGGESGDAMTVGFTDDAVAAALQTQLGADYAEWFAEDGSASAAVDAVQAAGAQLRAELNMYRNIIESNTGGKIDEQSFRNLPHVQRAYQRFYKAFDNVQSSMLNAAFQDAKNEIKLNYEYAEQTKIIPFIEDLSGSEMNQLIARHGEPVEVFKALISSESGLSIEEIETHLENGDLAKLKAWGTFTEKLRATARENSDNYAINAVQVEVQSADKRGETKAEALLRQRPIDIKKFTLDLLGDLESYSALSESTELNGAQLNDFTQKLGTLQEIMSSKAVTDLFGKIQTGNGGNTLFQDAADVLETVGDYQEKALKETFNAERFTQAVTANGPLAPYEVLRQGEDGKLRTVFKTELSAEKAARNQLLNEQANAALAKEDAGMLRGVFEQAQSWGMPGYGAKLLDQLNIEPDELGRMDMGQFNLIVESALSANVDIVETFQGDPLAALAAMRVQQEGGTFADAALAIDSIVQNNIGQDTLQFITDLQIGGVEPQLADVVRLEVVTQAAELGLFGRSAETQQKIAKLTNDAMNKTLKTKSITIADSSGVLFDNLLTDVSARWVNKDRNMLSPVGDALSGINERVFGTQDVYEKNVARIVAGVFVENFRGPLEEAGRKDAMNGILDSLVIGNQSAYIAESPKSFIARNVLVEGKEGVPGIQGFAHFDLEDAGSTRVNIMGQDGTSAPAYLLNNTKSFDKNYTQRLQATVQLADGRDFVVDLDPKDLQPMLGAQSVVSLTGSNILNSELTQTRRIGMESSIDTGSMIAYTVPEQVLLDALPDEATGEISTIDFSYQYAMGSETAAFAVSRALIDEAIHNTQAQRVSQ